MDIMIFGSTSEVLQTQVRKQMCAGAVQQGAQYGTPVIWRESRGRNTGEFYIVIERSFAEARGTGWKTFFLLTHCLSLVRVLYSSCIFDACVKCEFCSFGFHIFVLSGAFHFCMSCI